MKMCADRFGIRGRILDKCLRNGELVNNACLNNSVNIHSREQ